MIGRWAVRAACVAAAGLAATGLSGCMSSGPAMITTSAVFSDVGTLAMGAQVKMADVPVGSVSGISLDGGRAKVTMAIESGAHVPADVTAKVDRTTILGERYIALAAPPHPGRPLVNGEPIGHTAVVPTVEQVLGAGSQVFGAVSASDLAAIVNAGGQGFSGEAATLRQLLNSLSTVVTGYASRTAQITTAVNSLNQLGATLAPTSGPDAQAITNLSQTASVLSASSAEFEKLLQSLDSVSQQGATILSSEYPQIVDQLRALEAVASQLAQHQQDLAQLLQWLPQHDQAMTQVVRRNFLQIMNNLIVCGIPGGGSGSTAASTCAKGG